MNLLTGKTSIAALLLGVSAACLAAGEPRTPLVCSGDKPVKLMVGFVYIDNDGKRTNYGTQVMCFKKEIESELDVDMLSTEFRPRVPGDSLTIMGITTLRK